MNVCWLTQLIFTMNRGIYQKVDTLSPLRAEICLRIGGTIVIIERCACRSEKSPKAMAQFLMRGLDELSQTQRFLLAEYELECNIFNILLQIT